MNFEELRKSLLETQQLYVDEDFPAVNSSIYPEGESGPEYTWLRPKEICELQGEGLEPNFILDGASRFDIIQGDLGNCWMTVACTCITQNQSIFNRVVPPGQGFDPDNYCGAFYFCIWRYGEWVTVIVDDLLPTKDGKLVFAHSSNSNEFWGALLEKAYAKCHKSYKTLESGNIADGLTDFTGGVIECYDLQSSEEDGPDIPDIITKSFEKQSFATASITVGGVNFGFPYIYQSPINKFIGIQTPSMPQSKLPNGLVTNHAYNITYIKKVSLEGDEITLLRIRNPWGSDVEWNGDWSDNSEKWNEVPDDVKATVEFEAKSDGEFWMDYSEFRQNFHFLQICHQVDGDETDSSKAWSQVTVDSTLGTEDTTGGDTAEHSGAHPQFRLDFEETDKDVVIEVMQKHRRECGKPNLAIGFKLFLKPADMDVPLEEDYLKNAPPVAGAFRHAGHMWKTRSVLDRFREIRATCVLVVYTDDPGVAGSIMIRILSGK